MATKEYIEKTRNVVLKAIKSLDNNFHNIEEIRKIGKDKFIDEAPKSEIDIRGHRESRSWCVFDWTDRLNRYLNYWVKQDIVECKKEKNRYYYRYK